MVVSDVSKPVRPTNSGRSKPTRSRSSSRSRTGIAPVIHSDQASGSPAASFDIAPLRTMSAN